MRAIRTRLALRERASRVMQQGNALGHLRAWSRVRRIEGVKHHRCLRDRRPIVVFNKGSGVILIYLLWALGVLVIAPLLVITVTTWVKLARARKSRAASECLNALRT